MASPRLSELNSLNAETVCAEPLRGNIMQPTRTKRLAAVATLAAGGLAGMVGFSQPADAAVICVQGNNGGSYACVNVALGCEDWGYSAGSDGDYTDSNSFCVNTPLIAVGPTTPRTLSLGAQA